MTLLASATAHRAPELLLQKPLIIGASLSAGYSTTSPGDRLSRRFTSADEIRNLARAGMPGRDHAAKLTPDLLKDRSLVIAMDYLFWDSTLSGANESLASLDRLIQLTRTRRIPLIVGDIPELLPGRQPLRARLNKEIHRRCRILKDCYVLELDRLHRRVLRERALEIKGRRYDLRELVPDGLHLAELASEYLADFIFALPLIHPGR